LNGYSKTPTIADQGHGKGNITVVCILPDSGDIPGLQKKSAWAPRPVIPTRLRLAGRGAHYFFGLFPKSPQAGQS